MFFSFIKFRLALAISFKGNFHMRREETFIWTKLQWLDTFWNIVLTSVDKRNIHCKLLLYQKLWSLRKDCSNNLNLSDHVRSKYGDHRLQKMESIKNVLFVMTYVNVSVIRG